ncbi:MAG: phosphoribosyl-AMP cyclohydrolase [Hyphomicrobiaceae bacterium]
MSAPKDSSKHDLETGLSFTPRFDANGTIPVVTTDEMTGDVVMLAYMNAEALRLTIRTGIATYWSRSRQKLWVKGETSGNRQHVTSIRTDCDQDAIWLAVTVEGHGASCHQGFRSCFYRGIPQNQIGKDAASGATTLEYRETGRLFDPDEVYRKD